MSGDATTAGGTDLPEPALARPGSPFRHRGFVFYWTSRLAGTFGVQIVSVSVGWQIYDLTRDPFDLGLVGLVQFLPALLLVLVTGTVADRFDRRLIMAICLFFEMLGAALLIGLALANDVATWPIFAVLAGFGLARAFFGPASQAIVPNLVPPADLATAIAWSTSAWQISTIVGPVAGGLLYGLGATVAYGTATFLLGLATVLVLFVPTIPRRAVVEPADWRTLVAGFRYIWGEKVVLGAISLDLFAVLLGGATALLPVYARDLLEVGPWGLGLLRAAPGIGAILTAFYLTRRPIRDRAGLIMFACVWGFGLMTVVFGISTVPWLAILALALMGALDMVSVYVRETLLQLWTPDAVRGRVNAVNMVFVGASNELGEFRAGISAALIGAVPAVVIGGFGTMAVALAWAAWFPDLRRARKLDRAQV